MTQNQSIITVLVIPYSVLCLCFCLCSSHLHEVSLAQFEKTGQPEQPVLILRTSNNNALSPPLACHQMYKLPLSFCVSFGVNPYMSADKVQSEKSLYLERFWVDGWNKHGTWQECWVKVLTITFAYATWFMWHKCHYLTTCGENGLSRNICI